MGRPEYGGNPYEGQAAQNQAAIKKTGRKQEREDGIRRSQRLLLTWLIENPALFDKIKGIITADDLWKTCTIRWQSWYLKAMKQEM